MSDQTRDRRTPKRPFAPLALILSAALCFAAAGLGSAFTTPQIDGWYATIEKPPFNPPNWVFAPVWTVLFAIMALVLWQIWRTPVIDRETAEDRRNALTAFVVQLVLNVAWSATFFGLQSPGGALAVIVLLLVAIVWTIAAARPVIGWAAFALVPYALWVAYAMILNVSIVFLNA